MKKLLACSYNNSLSRICWFFFLKSKIKIKIFKENYLQNSFEVIVIEYIFIALSIEIVIVAMYLYRHGNTFVKL